MKARTLTSLFIGLLLLAGSAQASGASSPAGLEYAPARSTLVNGQPQESAMRPRMSGEWTRTNYKYVPNYVVRQPYGGGDPKSLAESAFQIGHAWMYNASSEPRRLTFKITRSSPTGSELAGLLEFPDEVKAAIRAQVQAKGYAVKEFRSADEAVGPSFEMTVSPGKTGHIIAWWGSVASGGSVQYDLFHGGEYYQTVTTPVEARFHLESPDINFYAWEE